MSKNVRIQWSDGVINDEIISREVQKIIGIKNGHKDTVGVPNDYPFNQNTIICFDDNGTPMFGQYLEHGKRKGKIRFKMIKKNFKGFRSRYWTLSCDSIDIVEQDGKIINPDKYVKENGIYIRKGEGK